MKRSARAIVVCFAALTASAPSLGALGQGSPREEEALIKRGLELREKGDDEAALREFRRAHELSGSGRALAQVALAEQALGRWADAEAHLIEAMRHDQEPWVTRNMRLFRQALSDIQSHLGALELSGGAAGAEVLINGARAGTLPLAAALRVPAGSVALEVRAPDHLPMLRTVIVPAGGLAREPVVLVPIPPSDTASSKPSTRSMQAVRLDVAPPPDAGPAGTIVTPSGGGWSTRRKVGAALAAGSVASLAVGVVFHLIRNSRASGFNGAGCTYASGTIGGPTGCSSRYDDIQQARDVAIGGYAGALVLGAGGAVLWLMGE